MLSRWVASFEASARRRAIRGIGHHGAFLLEHRIRKAIGIATWRFRPLDRPIFLWGAGRTGSYLLYDLLSLHPDLICTRGVRRRPLGLYGSAHHGSAAPDRLLENPFPPIEGGDRNVFREHPHIGPTSTFAAVEIDAVRVSYRRLAAGTLTKKRVLEKDPHYTFIVELLERAFPDAFHLHCVRHPHAVVHSYRRRMSEVGAVDEQGFWGWRPPGWEEFRDRSPEARAAWLAISTMQLALEQEERMGKRALRVSYEDCVRDPTKALRRVLSFCELSDFDRLRELPGKLTNYNRVEPLADLDVDLSDRLDRITRELGYRPSENAA